MPGPYLFGAHAGLQEVQAGLRELWRHARVHLKRAKTRVWNAAGEEPAHICALQLVGAVTVRVRDGELPHDQ